MTRAVRSGLDRVIDSALNVHTCHTPTCARATGKFDDGVSHEAAAWIHIQAILRNAGLHERARFVDYGCGVGRILCAAARYRIGSAVGVEIVPELAEIARENLNRLRGRKCEIELSVGDAAEFQTEGCTHAFFFNPFGDRTMRSVIDGLCAMAARSGKKVTVLYHHPVHADVFEDRRGVTKTRTLKYKGFYHPTYIYELDGAKMAE